MLNPAAIKPNQPTPPSAMTIAPMAAPIALPRYMADEFSERLTSAKAGFIATSRACWAVIKAQLARPQSNIAGITSSARLDRGAEPEDDVGQ